LKAKLKGLASSQVDLEKYWPDQEDSFCLTLELSIGPDGQEGQDLFYATICTPKWLQAQADSQKVLLGQRYVVVYEFNLDRIKEGIRAYCSKCIGSDWREVARKVSRMAVWEYEDLRPGDLESIQAKNR
jgi:hypothetical protein